MFTVHIEGLEFYGYHGVPAEERLVGHRYVVDLAALVDGSADATDRVEDTIDYGSLGQHIVATAAASQAHTLEHLAATLADAVMETDSRIAEVRLRVSKPLPPAPIMAARAGVEIVKRRGF